MSFLTFLVNYRGEIFSRTLEHLLLVAAAMLAAVLVGIPLGIALVRRHNLRRWVLGTANGPFSSVMAQSPKRDATDHEHSCCFDWAPARTLVG